ncbi:hypothetical protein BWZ20_06140 [Winogradskyella sp. J14-2]|uniref:hypothetical protein n=1 Tax=Winogradskyella sp. J14-2 TaxID=1936080 RepID=UPI0009728C4A|nr:hypothetical protein [Winogradskyella sp. J14-2]APY07907.1 hypothetical protein BWZ20_06140 [Winogradskyella sp. J14-2]
MELVLHQELESLPEPIAVSHYTSNGLLNSSYKSIVKHNFSKSTAKSVFGIRQRVKASQLSKVDHVAAILKLFLFVIALIAIF